MPHDTVPLPFSLGTLDLTAAPVQAWLNAYTARQQERNLFGKPLVLLGAGSALAQDFVAYAVAKGNVIALVDNARAGQDFNGIPYVGDAALPVLLAKAPDAIGVLCCGSENAIAYFTGVWGHRLQPLLSYFELLSQLPPEAAGKHIAFLPAFSDRDLITTLHEKARGVFSDSLSRRTLDAIMLYRLTWDGRYIAEIARPEKAIYFEPDVMPLTDHEILVDGGAYDGDTVRDFIAKTNGAYNHIHAFEIDPVNADAFTFKTQGIKNLSLHRIGLWNETAEMGMEHKSNNGSRVSETAEIRVPLNAMDNMDLGAVSLIKLDIEGAENQALYGAHNTIAKHKPKLAVCAYHKADDFSTILDTLSALQNEYRLSLRHYSPIIFDSVIYAI